MTNVQDLKRGSLYASDDNPKHVYLFLSKISNGIHKVLLHLFDFKSNESLHISVFNKLGIRMSELK